MIWYMIGQIQRLVINLDYTTSLELKLYRFKVRLLPNLELLSCHVSSSLATRASDRAGRFHGPYASSRQKLMSLKKALGLLKPSEGFNKNY